MNSNEFSADELAPGDVRLAEVNGTDVAVYNVDGAFFATQDACTHEMGELSDGFLEGDAITCPYHGACFNVKTGAVLKGPATEPLKTYRVSVADGIVRVEDAG